MKFPRLDMVVAGVALALAVGWPGVAPAADAPSTADPVIHGTPVERRVAPRKSAPESGDPGAAARPATEPASAPADTAVLERQIHSRFVLLNDCPAEVARHARLTAAALKARRLTLRWTILPTGRVADTAVVATSPVDPRVMDCVKRQMSLWSFTHPDGPMRVERPFTFRAH
jgi:hypothetical protein